MTHRYHVECSYAGCLPEAISPCATKREATDLLRDLVAEERDGDTPMRGSLASGWFQSTGTFRIFIERCDDPQCAWEDDGA